MPGVITEETRACADLITQAWCIFFLWHVALFLWHVLKKELFLWHVLKKECLECCFDSGRAYFKAWLKWAELQFGPQSCFLHGTINDNISDNLIVTVSEEHPCQNESAVYVFRWHTAAWMMTSKHGSYWRRRKPPRQSEPQVLPGLIFKIQECRWDNVLRVTHKMKRCVCNNSFKPYLWQETAEPFNLLQSRTDGRRYYFY